MTTRIGAALVIALALTACGESTSAVVSDLREVTVDDVGATDLVGAVLDDTTRPAEVEVIAAPTEIQAEAAVRASRDLIDAFIFRLGSSRFAEAATLTTGEARELIAYLDTARTCGFSFAEASVVELGSDAMLVGIDQFRVSVDVVLVIDEATNRQLTDVIIERQSNSSWLISDVLIDGQTSAELVIEPDSNIRNKVRLTPVEQCLGPTSVVASYTVENEGRDPFLPVDVFFRDSAGDRYEIYGGIEELTTIVPGRTVHTKTWELPVAVPRGLDGGAFVVVAADLDESRQEGETVLVEREYPIVPSPLFSDFNVTLAAILRPFDLGATGAPTPGR